MKWRPGKLKKKFRQILTYTGILLVCWILFGLSSAYQKNRACSGVEISIHDENNNYFLDLDDVDEVIRQKFGSPVEGTKMGEIKVFELENELRKNPYIREAEVYKSVNGSLKVDVALRRPVARVIPEGAKSFYLDDAFTRVPLSPNFSANCMLIRGDFRDLAADQDSIFHPDLRELKPFVEYIDGHRFWKAMISEVLVKEDGTLAFWTEVGDVRIEFGYADHVEDKLENLLIFYKKVLMNTGWDQYKALDVRYRDQVIGVKSVESI